MSQNYFKDQNQYTKLYLTSLLLRCMCNFPLNIAKGWTKNLSKKSFDISMYNSSKQERVCSLKDRSVEVLLLINCWKFYFGLTLEQFRISGGQITFFDFLQKMWTVVLSMLGVKIKQEQVCSLKDRIGWFYFWLIRIFLFRIFCSGISLNLLTGFVFLSKKILFWPYLGQFSDFGEIKEI